MNIQQELEQSRLLMQTLLSSLPDLVLVISEDGEYVDIRVNEGNESLLYVPKQKLIGSRTQDVFPKELSDMFMDVIHKTIETGENQILEYELDVPDGRRTFEGRSSKLVEMVDGKKSILWIARDITENKQNTKELKDSEERNRKTLELLLDGIVTIDKLGIIQSCNPAAIRMFGYTNEELIGQNIKMLMPEPHHSQHDGYLKRYDETRKAAIIGVGREVEGRKKDGTVFPVFLSVSEMRLGDKTYYIGTIRDITEQKRLEKSKSNFLATVSHEIRTPLNGILGSAQLLSRMPLDEYQQKLVKILRSSGGHLLSLIESILDYSKLDAGKLKIVKESFDITVCVKEVIELMKSVADEKGVGLASVAHMGDCSPVVLGDVVHLKQILLNLVGNAVKFTEKGRVSLTVTLSSENSRVKAYFKVNDTGIGIPQQQLKSLSEEFFRVDSSTTRKIGGTGLGLTICRRLIGLMGGELSVESQEGVGSDFYFTLLFDEGVNREETIAVKGKPSLNNLRILLVEDNSINQMIAVGMLGALGYSADTVENGLEALNQLERKMYDVIFMDIHMPVMDGIEATAKIIQRYPDKEKRPIIIALTADAMSGNREKYLNAGMDDYITKPVSLERLQETLSKYDKNEQADAY